MISDQSSPDSIKVGQWLFRHRTLIPIPVATALLVIPTSTPGSRTLAAGGVVLTALGEGLRFWAVRHIGVISRTRSERLGPLISTGPFALVRNPIYIANILIWAGFTLTAQLAWLAPIVALLLFVEYNAIVRWEETLLESRIGEAYREYCARVPRWLPTGNRGERNELRETNFSAVSAPSAVAFPWSATLFSERGTLMAFALGYLLLWLKAHS